MHRLDVDQTGEIDLEKIRSRKKKNSSKQRNNKEKKREIVNNNEEPTLDCGNLLNLDFDKNLYLII